MTRQAAYKKRKPYVRLLEYARRRCRDRDYKDFDLYGGRGIRCELTLEQVAIMWKRDGGASMVRPSIGRIDHEAGYVYSNCRIEEWSDNVREAFMRERAAAGPEPAPEFT